jgi:N-methylhydantoinase B
VHRRDGSEETVYKGTGIVLEAGDRVTFLTAGGGGWGDPGARDKAAIEHDIRLGFVSPEAAARDYGYPPPQPEAAE